MIVSINFGANLDAHNAANYMSGLEISKFFSGSMPPHTWPSAIAIPPQISHDKLWLIFFYCFVRFFPFFISNTSIVCINFGANLDAQNAGKCISGLQISTFFLGEYAPSLPYSCMVCRPHM
jgi:predicted transcriptional regulator